jgi:hypothetical protein
LSVKSNAFTAKDAMDAMENQKRLTTEPEKSTDPEEWLSALKRIPADPNFMAERNQPLAETPNHQSRPVERQQIPPLCGSE